METSNPQKLKLLVLYNYLLENTDENHPITTEGICKALKEKGISCDRRTLSRDIKLLNESGYEVMDISVGKKKGYYVYEKPLELAELKILLDAVQAASFIPCDKTERLTEKISSMGGSYRAELLQRNMVTFSAHKHSNSNVYICVDTIERAIQEGTKITFNYFHKNENRGNDYCKDESGERKLYKASPLAFLVDDNNYYLVAGSDEHDEIRQYRVDRMDSVENTDERIPEDILKKSEETIKEMRNRVFHMFSGETERVVLRFRRCIIDCIYDKFGENTQIWQCKDDPDMFETIVYVQVSPTFYGWVLQFGDALCVRDNDRVVSGLTEYIDKVKSVYNS